MGINDSLMDAGLEIVPQLLCSFEVLFSDLLQIH